MSLSHRLLLFTIRKFWNSKNYTIWKHVLLPKNFQMYLSGVSLEEIHGRVNQKKLVTPSWNRQHSRMQFDCAGTEKFNSLANKIRGHQSWAHLDLNWNRKYWKWDSTADASASSPPPMPHTASSLTKFSFSMCHFFIIFLLFCLIYFIFSFLFCVFSSYFSFEY